MTFLIVALFAGFAVATGIVLADSGLRLWSAFGTIRAQQAMLRAGVAVPAARRAQLPARVTTRVSFARPAPRPLRVAA